MTYFFVRKDVPLNQKFLDTKNDKPLLGLSFFLKESIQIKTFKYLCLWENRKRQKDSHINLCLYLAKALAQTRQLCYA